MTKPIEKFKELLILSHFPNKEGKYLEGGDGIIMSEPKAHNKIANYIIQGWDYDIKEMFVADKGKCLVKRVYWKRRVKK